MISVGQIGCYSLFVPMTATRYEWWYHANPSDLFRIKKGAKDFQNLDNICLWNLFNS